MKRVRIRQSEQIHRPPLILRSEAQSSFQRYGFRALTILFWLLFLSLFRIALTPLAWIVGAQSVYELFSYKINAGDFSRLLSLYGIIVLLIGLILIGWARYNQLRFSRRERRTFFLAPVASMDIAGFFQLAEEQVENMANSRRVTVSHDEDGHLVDVKAISSQLVSLPREPVLLQRHRYLYGDFLLCREKDFCWVVKREDCELFRSGTFEDCRLYVDSLTN